MARDSQVLGALVEGGKEDRDIFLPLQIVESFLVQRCHVVILNTKRLPRSGNEEVEALEHCWGGSVESSYPIKGRTSVM